MNRNENKDKTMKVQITSSVSALAVSFLLLACSSQKQETEQVVEKPKIQVMAVSAKDVAQIGTFSATVQAEITNNIAPQMSARIKNIFVEVGDHVREGQKLAEMDALNLHQNKLKMENDQTEFNRVDELYEVGGISKSVWDQRKLAYEISRSTYENLQENTSLLSPISGIVTKRNYDKGDMYNMALPLYVVEQIRPVKLIVNVSESLFTRVKKGMEVDITLDVYKNTVFKGIVNLVHPSVDPNTRTFPVEIRIRNEDEKIRPGMFARASFNYGDERRIMVSDRAVIKQSGSSDRYVFTCKDGIITSTKVLQGRLIGDEYEIFEGLHEGDIVAVSGHNLLDSGTEVEIVNHIKN